MEHSRISSSRFAGANLVDHADDIRESLHSALRIVDKAVSVPASQLPGQPVTERDVRSLLKIRRKRDQFFDGEMFADPAWDILLELYAAELGQQRISVGQLCVGAAVPGTTALRWISMLENKDLIERKADPMDGRRVYLSLSAAGLQAMTSYFKSIPGEARFI